ncbi:hypothetical protein DFJ58DRAFT_725600 [Suillus subalutaceus]|uniref:uncharacterized protein n=1 Tax=Suillus subalutaceus TaxID=48586 RepID=UPI001B87222E|nr:uncharacterized protein DFJ58DRAFT_725600 [Suillus subalutaceus]KAG1861757.1 hypothetical protein DFJ58DRAFT_725600 [Suillus subalutaceus]
MRGRCRELLKKNALLEASASQGWKKLTANKLALAVKQDAIKSHGHKYSMTHCLWIDTNLFPLHMYPNIDLSSKECLLSPLAIKDGVNTELFLFIPQTDHELMNYKNFGSSFAKGINSIRSEMVSDVKSCAGALLMNPSGAYTKFAPVLFPNPENPSSQTCLKTAKLIQVHFESLNFWQEFTIFQINPSWKNEGKDLGVANYNSRHDSSSSHSSAIFLLSGDKDLLPVGADSYIPYCKYHNWYSQRLTSGDKWSKDVLTFFNNSIFSASTSTTVNNITTQGNPTDTWEEDFEHALEDGVEAPVFSASAPPVLPKSLPPNEPPPQVSIDNTEMDSDAIAAAQSEPSGSISTAM